MTPPRNIFLLGLMRSGTTFLRNILSANQEILILGSELNRFWTEAGQAPCGTVPCCPHRSAEDAAPAIRDQVRQAFAAFYARRNHPLLMAYRAYRKIRYGNESIFTNGSPFYLLNKSTHLMNKIDYIRAIFPQARFIVLVRDIHSQVNSIRKHLQRIAARGYAVGYEPGKNECWSFRKATGTNAIPDFHLLSIAWIELHRQALKSFETAAKDRVCWVPYESLCRDPRRVLARLGEFMELDLKCEVDYRFVNASGRDPLNSWMRELSTKEQRTIEQVIADRHDEYMRIVNTVTP